MMRRRLGIALVVGSAGALAAASCVVGTFEKVEHFSGADASVGGSGGSSGTGGSGGLSGSAGMGQPCNNCESPGDLPICCFPFGNGDFECGVEHKDYDGNCVPTANPGDKSPGCPAINGHAGCCSPVGLCGFWDDLIAGCLPSEIVGVTPTQCQGSACGPYCLTAEAQGCALAMRPGTPTPIFACAKECFERPCGNQVGALSNSGCPLLPGCTSAGHPMYGACPSENYELAKCYEEADCRRYCQMVQDVCGANMPQYPEPGACEAICEHLGPGYFDQIPNENSVACRMHETTFGLDHCSTAGPLGSGSTGASCGGGACESFCMLLGDVCPDQLLTYGPDPGCIDYCQNHAPGNFAWPGDPTDPILCRFQGILDAIVTGNPSACSSAAAASPNCP